MVATAVADLELTPQQRLRAAFAAVVAGREWACCRGLGLKICRAVWAGIEARVDRKAEVEIVVGTVVVAEVNLFAETALVAVVAAMDSALGVLVVEIAPGVSAELAAAGSILVEEASVLAKPWRVVAGSSAVGTEPEVGQPVRQMDWMVAAWVHQTAMMTAAERSMDFVAAL